MSGNTKQNRFWILCAVLFCAVLLLVSAAAASTTASITITGVYKGAPPQPDFTYTPTNPITGQSVTFTGTSTGSPISWSWNFGDGTTGTGQTTSHSYSSAGTYTVTLTVTNSAGLTGTKSKPITVTAPPLRADFTATQTNCVCPWKVTFNDISTGNPTSRVWAYQKVGTTTWTAFGSGATSPTLSFSSSATYKIRLIVYRGTTESNTIIKSITPGTLKAAFSASTTRGLYPMTVTFTDSSVGLPTKWKWEYQKSGTTTWTEFGSGARNPTFTPGSSGKFSIRLTVTNTANTACGSNTVTKNDYITVINPCDPVVASFSGSKTSGNKPLTVKFTDSSTGPIISWQWDFQNDGTYDSTLQNPSFKYINAGKYSVKLTVTNACPTGPGTSTLIRTNYITVT
jgi:tripartite motif-containing protein 71